MYKILQNDKTYKCDFLDNSITKITNKLCDLKISYQIIYREKNPYVKDFKKNNQYSKYKLNALQKVEIKERMYILVEKVKSLNEEQAKQVIVGVRKMFRINNNNFKILQKYKTFLMNLDNSLENIPRKDIYFKARIKTISLDVLKDILLYSYDTSSVKIYRISIKANIALLDFMLERLLLKRYISKKTYINLQQS